LGGDKIALKDNQQKVVEKKAVKVEITNQAQPIFHKPQELQHA